MAAEGVELAVAVINPRRAREFAEETDKLSETDAIDAAALARSALAIRPAACEPGALRDDRLLVGMRTMERNGWPRTPRRDSGGAPGLA